MPDGFKRCLFFIFCFALFFCNILINSTLIAQTNAVPEMADVMRSNGKIYVVVAVCLTILVGLFIYVFSVDRRIKKWEKEKE